MTVRVAVELTDTQYKFLARMTRHQGEHPVGSLVADMTARELAASPVYKRFLELQVAS